MASLAGQLALETFLSLLSEMGIAGRQLVHLELSQVLRSRLSPHARLASTLTLSNPPQASAFSLAVSCAVVTHSLYSFSSGSFAVCLQFFFFKCL